MKQYPFGVSVGSDYCKTNLFLQLLQLYFDEAILQIGDEAALGQIQITKRGINGLDPNKMRWFDDNNYVNLWIEQISSVARSNL